LMKTQKKQIWHLDIGKISRPRGSRLKAAKKYLLAFLVLALASLQVPACTHNSRSAEPQSLMSGRAIPLGPKPTARTRASFTAQGINMMVATAHPLATDAAYLVLRQGGNAVDAAVAASFMISVVRPQSTGIGGGGFWLFYDQKARQNFAYDFRERAPAKATAKMYYDSQGRERTYKFNDQTIEDLSVNGHLAVAVPGLVAGLAEVHRKHGRLPWQQLVAPAEKVAAQGFSVYTGLAAALKQQEQILKKFPSSARIFYPEGRLLKEGDRLVQADLAKTLQLIGQEGPQVFYRGSVAKLIVAEIARGQGILSEADLERYQVILRKPLEGTYLGRKVVSMPPPSSGGVHVIQMLNMLGRSPEQPGPLGSAAQVHQLAEVMKRAFADRAKYLGDPDFVKVPVGHLISPDYAAKLVKTIDQDSATPAKKVSHGEPIWRESPSTTHISIVDRDGNGVSTTQTINYSFGSSVVAEGTGIVLNNEMDDFSKKPGVPNVFGLVGSAANAIAPGKTMLSSMSPTFVFDKSGALDLVVGSPGGPKIITATLQTIVNRIAYQMPLADAVHHARIHHQWLPDTLVYEKGLLTADVVNELKRRGHSVRETPDPLGDVQAVARENGVWSGVSDIRSDGIPRGK
jgi:gamma-glutamyltranspeptidase/glutathione hydrolase